MEAFNALVADRTVNGVKCEIRRLSADQLPPGELLVRVAYSSLNYKDALAAAPDGNVVKTYPFVPGIDLAGTVVSSEDGRFREGEEILATGYGLGVTHFGGYGEYARIPADWAVPLPDGLTLKEAMICGTAGFTAALSVQALRDNGVVPEGGPVLVTGATGGVGSVAVAILSKLGYEVTASTGKPEAKDELLGLGAASVIDRGELTPAVPRSLDKQRWAGVVDCVGGKPLAAVLGGVKYGGTVAASGLTGGTELPATVFPFILRGVRLIGIDSVFVPMPARRRTWELLASEYRPVKLHELSSEIALADVPAAMAVMLAGKSKGRNVVKL
ncbi:oxidoreductase [Cohnella cellulosilytica]|uniref:Oxidoreductase n=1 Tax=Cohnella cellulosilytica TaxID=986710 RepID=A0ABW2F9F6_9BACL